MASCSDLANCIAKRRRARHSAIVGADRYYTMPKRCHAFAKHWKASISIFFHIYIRHCTTARVCHGPWPSYAIMKGEPSDGRLTRRSHIVLLGPGLFLPIPSSSPSRSWSISIGTFLRSEAHQPWHQPINPGIHQNPCRGGREIKLTSRVKHQKVAWTWSPSTVEALDTFMPPPAPSAFATLQGGALRMLCFLLPGHKIFVMSCHVQFLPSRSFADVLPPVASFRLQSLEYWLAIFCLQCRYWRQTTHRIGSMKLTSLRKARDDPRCTYSANPHSTPWSSGSWPSFISSRYKDQMNQTNQTLWFPSFLSHQNLQSALSDQTCIVLQVHVWPRRIKIRQQILAKTRAFFTLPFCFTLVR